MMKSSRGFTLIELVIAIVIGGLISIPLMTVFYSPLSRDPALEAGYTALNLAREKIEIVSHQGFSSITSEAETPFSGDFSDFKSVVVVNYVASSELEVPVDPAETDYKRIKVTVTSDKFPSLQRDLSTVVTDVSNE